MICENCGLPLENNNIVIDTKEDGIAHLFCRKCAILFGTCLMCSYNYCSFLNVPDPMPQFKIVARQVRQGSSTFIEEKQILNPDRVKKFCAEGKCKCFLDNPEHSICYRHDGYTTCTNYHEKEKYNFIQDFSVQKASEN